MYDYYKWHRRLSIILLLIMGMFGCYLVDNNHKILGIIFYIVGVVQFNIVCIYTYSREGK